MSRRTSEAVKAVRAAWENEQNLVLEGKGTRDWTRQQQQDIIDKGKAYDEDGRAIEGHHMKSVEAFPDFQGDPANIQFLSRTEHQEAHGGNFQNPSNGYYDPVAKVTYGFGDNPFEPCKVIELSDPIIIKNVAPEKSDSSQKTESDSQQPDKAENSQSEQSSPKETASAQTTPGQTTSAEDLNKETAGF